MGQVIAVMVVVVTGDYVETKVSRVYKDAKAAEKYRAELDAAIKSGQRKDVLAVWLQTNVRSY